MNRIRILSMLVLSFFWVTQGIALAGSPSVIPGSSPPLSFPSPRIIIIFDKGLDTPISSIYRYTEVTWINDSNSGVRIEFGKGPNCEEVSAAAFPALGIRMQPHKCFVTNAIPPKGTLRFRFKESGYYHYEVEYVRTNRIDDGELKVF